MISRTLSLLAITILLSSTARAETCDCSCASFSELESRVALFEQQLDRGQTALVTPELQSSLQCVNPCIEQWLQCAASRSRPIAAGAQTTMVKIEQEERQLAETVSLPNLTD